MLVEALAAPTSSLALRKKMKLPSKYILDTESIKLNSYRLICYFYANKEIARSSDPEERQDNVAKLEEKYFFSEISKLLIDIAISIRILDDQMKSLPTDSELRWLYDEAMKRTNQRYNCMMFDGMNLREVCNKIIHADLVEPHIQEAEGSHEIDHYNWLGWSEAVEHSDDQNIPKPEPIKWHHLTNNVRLGGKHKGKEWFHLLQVPIFVEAIVELFK